jgi:hypothetical protein
MSDLHDPQELGFIEPHYGSEQWTNDARNHSDGRHLRRIHGMPKFDPDQFDEDGLVPAFWDHTWDGGRDQPSGGVEWFATGPPNSGKTTLALRAAQIDMEVNNSRVVWRAATGSRSEWLPYAPVAHVCLPKGYEATARVVPKGGNRNSMGKEVPLEDVVRKVTYYSDIMDLNLNVLQDGVFHVVYPDPKMRGCQWVYEESDKVVDGVKFQEGDPVDHWWFGWALSLVERGPFDWTTWICDEVASLAREGVSKDKYATLQKVQLAGTAVEDFRKNGIIGLFFGHKDKHLHNLWTDRIRWRVAMNGTANPHGSSSPKGFESVPMTDDITSDLDIGEAVMYNEQAFTWPPISWPPIEKPIHGDLKVYLSEIDSKRAAVPGGASA